MCKVDRGVGPTHCPVACQIEPGEGMYIPICTLTESIYFPGMILGFCIYYLEIAFLFCTIVDHKPRYILSLNYVLTLVLQRSIRAACLSSHYVWPSVASDFAPLCVW